MKHEPIQTAPSLRELTHLHEEIRRYLDAIEVFRREGHEPHWQLEGATTEVLT